MIWRHPGWTALILLAFVAPAHAQFTDPRNYQNVPVGVNQLEVAYAYARADASIDPYIVITGAHLNLNEWDLSYTRYFGLFGRTAWFSPGVPLAVLDGAVEGTNLSGSIGGAGDTSYEFAMLLKGGPALSPEEFGDYKLKTSVGLSLIFTAPTGLYRADKILNLGADRWSFKPEFGVSFPFGPEKRWVVDGYANSYFYTNNTSYRGVQILRQSPLPGFEGHVSYAFGKSQSVVSSLDTRYSFRGDTSLNGIGQDDPQKNFILGTETVVAVNNKNQLTFIYEQALVHDNGPSTRGVSIRYDYLWGRGYK